MSPETPKSSLFASVRNAFISGLFMLTPLAITWVVFSAVFERVGGGFRDTFFFFVPEHLRKAPSLDLLWNILATLIVVLLVTLLGYVSRYVLGKYFGNLTERFILNIPGVGNVYNTVKQIVATFGTQHRQLFSKVVLVEFPRAGVYSIAFLTSKTQGEAQAKSGIELWSVFVPTSPNPTGGYLLLLPKDQIIELDMSVGDGMKMVISGGAVVPPWTAPSRPPLATASK